MFDGVRGLPPLLSNEGYFAHLNQVFAFLELVFQSCHMWKRVLIVIAAVGITSAATITAWVAYPTNADLNLPAPLQPATDNDLLASRERRYAKDLAPLAGGFSSQTYRSFCGPASITTVLHAYGARQAEQTGIFDSTGSKLDAFFTGMSLSELGTFAAQLGLHGEIVYADAVSANEFRERMKANLATEGDFVLVNYDRRVLSQAGAGHISPVGAYDEARDAFLVLDTASYKYPFTWVPASLLYEAAGSRDGERSRGLLLIHAYVAPH